MDKTQFEYIRLRVWEGLMEIFCKWCIRGPVSIEADFAIEQGPEGHL